MLSISLTTAVHCGELVATREAGCAVYTPLSTVVSVIVSIITAMCSCNSAVAILQLRFCSCDSAVLTKLMSLSFQDNYAPRLGETGREGILVIIVF